MNTPRARQRDGSQNLQAAGQDGGHDRAGWGVVQRVNKQGSGAEWRESILESHSLKLMVIPPLPARAPADDAAR